MVAADVTAVTTAYAPAGLFDTFILFAPWVLSVAGILIAVGLIHWGVRTVRQRLSGGAA